MAVEHRLSLYAVLQHRVVAAVAAVALVVLDAGAVLRAATPTGATVEAFAVFPDNRHAVRGGVVQSGTAQSPGPVGITVSASGPLDGTGVNPGDQRR